MKTNTKMRLLYVLILVGVSLFPIRDVKATNTSQMINSIEQLSGDRVSGYIPVSTNVRDYYTNKKITKFDYFTKIEGVRKGKWISINYNGKLAKIYDFGIINGEKIEGKIQYATNVRTYPKGDLITRFDAGTYISGIKDGDWIRLYYNNRLVSMYDFGIESESTDDNIGAVDKIDKPITIERELPSGTYYPVFVDIKAYKTAQDAYDGTNYVSIYEPGIYYIYKVSGDIINISRVKGAPGAWINSYYNDRSKRVTPERNTTEFINKISLQSQDLAAKNDLYASVMIAQAILESGAGTSVLGESPFYNLFGMKGDHNGNSVAITTNEYKDSIVYQVVAPFKVFSSYEESLQAYVDLVTGYQDPNNWRYKFYYGIRKSQTQSYKDATAYLSGRYATSQTYGESLNRIIESYNLTRFDVK